MKLERQSPEAIRTIAKKNIGIGILSVERYLVNDGIFRDATLCLRLLI